MKLHLPQVVTVPRVGNCCFCINLRTGSLLLGWFGSFVNLLGILFFGLAIQALQEEDPQVTLQRINLLLEDNMTKEDQLALIRRRNDFLILSFLVFTIMCLLDLITNALLLVGIYKKRPAFISQWLISSIFWFTLAVAGQVLHIIGMAQSGYYYSSMYAFTICFIGFGLRFYWWLSVYSVYDLVKHGKPLDQPWDAIDENDDEEKAINTKE